MIRLLFMRNRSIRFFWYTLMFAALLINESTVQWALAVLVGELSIIAGFNDAFGNFSLSGYAFFSAFRFIPYLILAFIVKRYLIPKWPTSSAIAWGGLCGIVVIIVWGSWSAMHAYYTDAQISSTTAIAFLFIPFYAIVGGLIGGLLAALGCYTVGKTR